MEFLKTFLGGAGGAAIVAGLFALIQWLLTRKAHKEDKAADQKIADCAARGKEISGLRDMVNGLIIAERENFYNLIKDKAKKYIKRGWIYVEEYEDLKRMHSVYHDPDKLNGNGFLDALMSEVDHLEKRVL